MKNLIMCLLFLIASSCGKDNLSNQSTTSAQALSSTQKVLSIPDELKNDFNEINQDLTLYPKLHKIDNLIIEFSTDDTLAYENEARGICIKSSPTPKIILYRRDFLGSEGIGSYSAGQDSFQKTASLYHLIGHCIFDKAHNDATYQYGAAGETYVFNSPKSFMHSSFKESLFSYHQLEAGYTPILTSLKSEFGL